MKVDGVHHVTAITADIEANLNFYGRLLVAAFVGLPLPVMGAGITLSRHVSPKDTILGFAIGVSTGIAASAIKLVGRTTPRAGRGPAAAGRGAYSPGGKPGHQPIDKPEERRAP
jgi:catechol 2,3-dioxygenase-like lactoylglutathione lyase family enzyme